MYRIRRCSWRQRYSWEIQMWRAVAETKPQRAIVYRTGLHVVCRWCWQNPMLSSRYRTTSWAIVNVATFWLSEYNIAGQKLSVCLFCLSLCVCVCVNHGGPDDNRCTYIVYTCNPVCCTGIREPALAISPHILREKLPPPENPRRTKHPDILGNPPDISRVKNPPKCQLSVTAHVFLCGYFDTVGLVATYNKHSLLDLAPIVSTSDPVNFWNVTDLLVRSYICGKIFMNIRSLCVEIWAKLWKNDALSRDVEESFKKSWIRIRKQMTSKI